jgi:DNA topoisomerase-1
MANNLVVVESPAKASTIEKYLGEDFSVIASYGHVRDLPRSDFAVEVNGEVGLRYEVPSKSAKAVKAIRSAAAKADQVYLATDLDREGEAIAWHVAEVAELDTDQANRVVFAEITRDAILEAFNEPRAIDGNLVNAQQARRAVDRIVGYRLSPTLWRNVASGISAGRVQSVALRLICDREEEIRAFAPAEYWSLHGDFRRDGQACAADLHQVDGLRVTNPKHLAERVEKGNEGSYRVVGGSEEAQALTDRARAMDSWTVANVTRKETKRNPAPPFITSTLQQEAARKLNFSAAQTMRVAQQLYEGISVGSEGAVGLITYMRTDSVNLSNTALAELAELVAREYGERYALDSPRRYSGQKRAQEAHEAIRPTSARRRPDEIAGWLSGDQRALYDLIWKRTVATQMQQAVFDSLRADIVGRDSTAPDGSPRTGDSGDGQGSGELVFRVTGKVLKFDGFIAVYQESRDDSDDEEGATDELPQLEDGQVFTPADLTADQHFTEPPPRYSEASLVKTLEAEGIGRPSTYAQIIQVLSDREYVRLDSRRFFPTPLGEVVTAYLKRHFAEVVDTRFTARMEDELDAVAAGRESWEPMVTEFLAEVDNWIAERKPERPRIPLDGAECPACGGAMDKVFSGKSRQWFASCQRWPDCDGTLPLDESGKVVPEEQLQPDPDVPCPNCGKPTVRKQGRFGPFYGCQDYPDCKGIVNVERRIGFVCPRCEQGQLVERRSRYGKYFYGCNRYPECQFALWTTPLARPCPHCGGPMKPPRKNAKTPTAVCANCDERVEVEADPARVESEEFVPGKERVSA